MKAFVSLGTSIVVRRCLDQAIVGSFAMPDPASVEDWSAAAALEAFALEPGEYRAQVMIESAAGAVLSTFDVPGVLLVRDTVAGPVVEAAAAPAAAPATFTDPRESVRRKRAGK
jgi:Asp/Glu/hydantoin racemase